MLSLLLQFISVSHAFEHTFQLMEFIVLVKQCLYHSFYNSHIRLDTQLVLAFQVDAVAHPVVFSERGVVEDDDIFPKNFFEVLLPTSWRKPV